MMDDTQPSGRRPRGFAGDVAKTGDSRATIDDGHNDLADLIDQAGLQNSAVECATAFEEKLANTEHFANFSKCGGYMPNRAAVVSNSFPDFAPAGT